MFCIDAIVYRLLYCKTAADISRYTRESESHQGTCWYLFFGLHDLETWFSVPRNLFLANARADILWAILTYNRYTTSRQWSRSTRRDNGIFQAPLPRQLRTVPTEKMQPQNNHSTRFGRVKTCTENKEHRSPWPEHQKISQHTFSTGGTT